jgi:D-serine deaminase-like pyridoxal phosphate-dependent protein
VPTFVVAGSVLTSRQDGSLVLDIGVKRIGIDWGDPVLVGVDAAFRYIAEEHTVFQVLSGKRPGVGERVAMVPGHACTTLTRYRRIVGSRNGNVEAIFDVDGRDTLD